MSRHLELLWALARAPDEVKQAVWSALSPADVRAFAWDWSAHALHKQREPRGDWRVWLLLAGRGFGKTRAGAEWVLKKARCPEARIALVGASLDEVARVMVEGESGLLRCAAPGEEPEWLVSRHELRFRSGAVAHAYSGGNGDGLRGPQHHFAWADELGKWSDADSAWDNLMMGMRLGDRPRVLVTTTPGNSKLLKRIMAGPDVVTRQARTVDNIHLPPAFLQAMEAAYRGSRLGRQELDGELLEEAEGALWTRDLLDRCRVPPPAEEALRRVVVGVDPPATSTGDACGIVVCGMTVDGRGLVLADTSVSGEGPTGWARRVVAAAEAWAAEKVVAEVNNGGDMVEAVLRQVESNLPVRKVRASRGKAARAEPIAAMFEVGKCGLGGFFPELEDELSAMTVAGFTGGGSPDRADAMLWALSELMLGKEGSPRVRGV